jgi:DNA-binding beta-propeller fold protein YncE
MDQHFPTPPRLPAVRMSRVLTWLAGIVCYGFMLSVLALIARQIIVPPPAQRVLLVGTIPLPEGLKAKGAPDSLTPNLAQDFDNFGYEAIDPTTHLLFITHTGPVPYNYSFEDRTFHWDNPADIARDGNILVFDLQRQKLVGRVPIPRATGLVVAPDLHKVFVAGSEQSRIYSFDEPSLTNIKYLQLADNDDPDSLSYDPLTHKLFVAAPGAHVRYPIKVPGLKEPILNENIDPIRENVFILDAPTLRVLAKINIGKLPKLPGEDLSNADFPVPTVAGNIPKFGYFVGQIKYNDKTHLLYLVIQVAGDNNIRPHPLPPLGTAELVTIDPVTDTIIHRTILPESCGQPHALALDPTQQIAYMDCTSVDSDVPLVQHVIGMDLRTMKAFPDDPRQTMLAPAPNMLAVDRPQQLLFEACAGGITVFDVRPGHFRKLGNYVIGRKTTSIILDEVTQFIYLPVTGAGGRPTLVIAKYNPRGI